MPTTCFTIAPGIIAGLAAAPIRRHHRPRLPWWQRCLTLNQWRFAARIGRLESYESEAARLSERFEEASADIKQQDQEVSDLKRALKSARQQAVSAIKPARAHSAMCTAQAREGIHRQLPT